MKLLLLLALLISPNAHAEDWESTDKLLLGSFIGMQVIDVMQTNRAIGIGGHELNPIFGDKPTAGELLIAKGFATTAIYLLADNYKESRRPLLLTVNAIQFIVIRHNYLQVGVKFGF